MPDDQTLAAYEDSAQELATSQASERQAYAERVARHVPPVGRVLDVGTGGGHVLAALAARKQDVLGVEPSAAMRQQALAQFPELGDRVLAGHLPDGLPTDQLGAPFDTIVCSAVLQHLPRGELLDAVVRLRNLLAVGGRALVSVPASRPDAPTGRDPRGRLFNGVARGELQLLFERVGFSTVSREEDADSLGRTGVSWTTFVFELRQRGREGYPLERLERVISVDRKTATYKFALLRALTDIATTTVREARWRTDDTVGIPIGRIADLWIEYYWPLVAHDVPQIVQGRPLGFQRRLTELAAAVPGDLPAYLSMVRQGSLSPDQHRVLKALRSDVAKTVKVGPVTYAGRSSSASLFSYDKHRREVVVDGPLWREFAIMGHWIRDSLLLRWAELSRAFALARKADDQQVYANAVRLLTQPPVPERDVGVAQAIYRDVPDLRCAWTGKKLGRQFHVDHAIAYSLWHNNDLWNLLPASSAANLQKSDRLPQLGLLKRQRPVILDCWAASKGHAPERFARELSRLAGSAGDDLDAGFEAFVEAVESTALQRGCERWEPAGA